MITSAPGSVVAEVKRLAKDHKVTARRDRVSRMASTITRLAGDSVTLDRIEQLLVNLKRKGVLSTSEILDMQVRYLFEKDTGKPASKKTARA